MTTTPAPSSAAAGETPLLDTDFSIGAVGATLEGWRPPPAPPRAPLQGRLVRLEPLDAEAHADALFEANAAGGEALWTYLPYGPLESREAYRGWVEQQSRSEDPLFFALLPMRDGAPGPAAGVASWLRITPASGVIEVGHICLSPALQGTAAATEALILMARRVFSLGYRRYEWKCDALNQPSRRAAMRLGFSYEGVFRQATVVKGRNRDTAWYAMTDTDWPALSRCSEQWLDPANFDGSGRQRAALSALTAPHLAKKG